MTNKVLELDLHGDQLLLCYTKNALAPFNTTQSRRQSLSFERDVFVWVGFVSGLLEWQEYRQVEYRDRDVFVCVGFVSSLLEWQENCQLE